MVELAGVVHEELKHFTCELALLTLLIHGILHVCHVATKHRHAPVVFTLELAHFADKAGLIIEGCASRRQVQALCHVRAVKHHVERSWRCHREFQARPDDVVCPLKVLGCLTAEID